MHTTGIDFHYENLIACGEYPVPVDLETIYHHSAPQPGDDPDLTDEVTRRLQQSVLATHFLPNPVKANDRHYDISAIARSAEEQDDLEGHVLATHQHRWIGIRLPQGQTQSGAKPPAFPGPWPVS